MLIHHIVNKCDLQTFVKIVGLEYQSFPNNYVKMAEEIGITSTVLFDLVPKKVFNKWCDLNNQSLKTALKESENSRYFASYEKIRKFQRILVAPHIDKKQLIELIETQEHEGLKDQMRCFLPDSKGFVSSTTYSNCSTVTGRLTVVEGPNPLVMRNDVKTTFRSRHRKGKILQLDLSAAEPRTALNVIGKNLEGDVYERIAEEVLESKVMRQVAKQVVICALYGQSSKNLAQNLPLDMNAASVIRKVKDYFEYEKLLSMIRSTSHERNRIRNALGRPIVVAEPTDSMLLSYYLQSSAAEISILLFADFCRRMGNYVEPLYVIHDALLVDCDEESASFLLGKKSINLRHENWNYPVKVSEIEAR
jgi:hypothetical protein